ncbi:MAG: hypothetical protein ABI243_15880 [Lapillicoccus sp.]
MPENDISDIALADILDDLRGEGIDPASGPGVVIPTPRLARTSGATLAQRLDALHSGEIHTLHERRRPWTLSKIDHLVVCPAGIVVVEPLSTRARPTLRLEGGAGQPRLEKLTAGDRDCSKRVDSLLQRVRAVTRAIDRALPALHGVDVHAVLCSMTDDWPPHGGAFTVRGVHVLSPARLSARVAAPGPLRADEVDLVTAALIKAFPQA